METSLHRQLKALYSDDASQVEVVVDGFRIDVACDDRLVEIQCASLAAIRDKIRRLLRNDHRVWLVKPLAARKYLVKRSRKRGKIVSARYSPLRESYYDLFLELVHFTGVFPHPQLTLEVLLTEQEEHRLPARRWPRTRRSYRVEDRRLREIQERRVFETAEDLAALLPAELPLEFTTADIAAGTGIPRWLAQKMAYCLRRCGAIHEQGRSGNARIYVRHNTATAAEPAA